MHISRIYFANYRHKILLSFKKAQNIFLIILLLLNVVQDRDERDLFEIFMSFFYLGECSSPKTHTFAPEKLMQ